MINWRRCLKGPAMNITIRNETESDHRETENVTREAFWDLYQPGCVEHLVLHQLRQSDAFIPELDLVACEGERIIGNIVYTRAKVKNGNDEKQVLCMGPLSVLPEYQKKSVGSFLLRTTISKARAMGYPAVVIFGDPEYYHRFGFVNAQTFEIQTSEGQNLEPFMVLDLTGKGLTDIKGKFFEDAAFQSNPEDLEKFEQQFPPKEKHVLEGQLR
jgi:predicted N-acetyltransferase YhbS